MFKSHWGATGLALVILLPFSAVAQTTTAPGMERDPLVEVLLEKGVIDESDVQAVEEEARKRAAALPPAVSTEPEVDPKGYTIKYKNNLQIQRNDGDIKLNLGGRIQGDYASSWSDSALQNAVGQADGHATEFRRARIYLSGELYDRVIFKAQYDFAGGDTAFNDVYIGLTNLGPVGTVKVGHMKEPFSLEELTSSKYITFMERALPSVFDSSRNFGLMAENNHLDQRMTWGLGIFAPSDSSGEFFSAEPAFNVTGRITGLPCVSEDGSRLLHLGASASYQYREMAETSFSQRPESHLALAFLDTGDFVSDGNTILNGELAWVHGPWSVQGEWKGVWLQNGAGAGTAFGHGAYAQASWFATGEHRAYKRSSGVFSRVSPDKPFNPLQGKWGAVELAARYSYLTLNDDFLAGGEEQNVTAGINWYLFSNLRLIVNYVFADVKSTGADVANPVPVVGGQSHILQSRAQLEF